MESNSRASQALYDKTHKCPVCETTFTEKAVKTGKSRLISKDTDLMPTYEGINLLLYDVLICPSCGYAALNKFFNTIKKYQTDLILNNITPKYRPRNYPEFIDVDSAIDRYKIALLNTMVKMGKASEVAYTCLRLAWLYRLKEDSTNEMRFLEQATVKFKEAYEKEQPPIAGMDTHTLTYLIGELSRRVGNTDEALVWFSKLIVSRGVSERLKDLAREQKDLIKSGT